MLKRVLSVLLAISLLSSPLVLCKQERVRQEELANIDGMISSKQKKADNCAVQRFFYIISID